jgi:parallel beta-helix repeat protein
LKCIPILFTIPTVITSCIPSLTKHAEAATFTGVGTSANVIYIDTDTKLTSNPSDTRYVVTGGATLDLNGFVIDGRNAQGKQFTSVELRDGSSVKNGEIRYSSGGVVVTTNPETGWQQALVDLPQKDRRKYITELRDRITASSSISDIKFTQNKIDIYVTAFSNHTKIINNVFEKGRIDIYLDTYSHHAEITHNLFSRNGDDYFIKKWGVSVPYSRESIAVDNSSNNVITNNTFDGSVRGGIYLYKNCGEANGPQGQATPREGGSNDNVISDNCFRNFKPNRLFPKEEPAIWIASRRLDRKTYPCRTDDEGDIVLRTVTKDNKFENVYLKIKDDSNV